MGGGHGPDCDLGHTTLVVRLRTDPPVTFSQLPPAVGGQSCVPVGEQLCREVMTSGHDAGRAGAW